MGALVGAGGSEGKLAVVGGRAPKGLGPGGQVALGHAALGHAADALLEFESPSAAVIATPAAFIARAVTWVISALVISAIATAALIPVDKVVTAQGKVVAATPSIVVQPLETAIVRAINVREGELVHAGDLLAQLDPTFAAADMGSLETQVDSLQAEVDRLRAEANGTVYTGAGGGSEARLQAAAFAQRQAERVAKLENYQRKIDSLQTQIARDVEQAAILRQRLSVASSVETMRQTLEHDKVGSRLNSLAATDTRLGMQRDLSSDERSAESNARERQALIAERDAFVQAWNAEISKDLVEQGRKLADAAEQLKKAKLRRQLVELRAPQDAVVMTVAKVSVGSVLQSGSQFLTLVPANAPLELETNVLGRDAGFVHVGDPVAVKFDTFPFTQYGFAEGRVRVVSPDSFSHSASSTTQEEQALADPAIGAQTFYRVRISLDRVKLHDTPVGFHLVPGMPVTADIKVGKRTVLDYMLGRVLPVAMDGMREP